jgi:hypothetical protein
LYSMSELDNKNDNPTKLLQSDYRHVT